MAASGLPPEFPNSCRQIPAEFSISGIPPNSRHTAAAPKTLTRDQLQFRKGAVITVWLWKFVGGPNN